MTSKLKPAQKPAFALLDPSFPEPMVQMYYITAGDVTYALVGPITHVPELGIEIGTIQKIEIGGLLPASIAAKFVAAAEGIDGDGAAGRGQGAGFEDRGPRG